MRVIATNLGTAIGPEQQRRSFLEKIIRAVLPAANPDTEPLFAKVRLWWIEIDDAGTPQRELGFGATKEVLVASPLGENMGYWTDSPMEFTAEGEYEPVDPHAFEGY